MAEQGASPGTSLEEAIRPFLRSRQDATRIRLDLHSYLERNLTLQDQHLHVNNLTDPPSSQPIPDAPSALSGVHKAYWNALKAHREARAKYAQLKSEVEDLVKPREGHAIAAMPKPDDILPLLRQRERQRRLQVIQSTLDTVTSDESCPASVVVDDFVKARAGAMPILPDTSAVQHGHSEDAEARILELKKAILTAKAAADNHRKLEPLAAVHEPHAELYALQQTRNMLINWIEKQLVVIGDAQAANEKPALTTLATEEDAAIPVSQDEIAQIYEQYLNTRQKLLQLLQHPKKHVFESDHAFHSNVSSAAETQSDSSDALAATILPYVRPFLELIDHGNITKQQLASTKRQLDTSETAVAQLLRRLGDESHLVLPGSAAGQDWHQASNKAKQSTSAAINAKVKNGMKAAGEAEDALQKIKALSSALEAR